MRQYERATATHQPGRWPTDQFAPGGPAVGHLATQSDAGLGHHDALDQLGGTLELADQRGGPPRRRHSLAAQASAGVEGRRWRASATALTTMVDHLTVMALASSLASAQRQPLCPNTCSCGYGGQLAGRLASARKTSGQPP